MVTADDLDTVVTSVVLGFLADPELAAKVLADRTGGDERLEQARGEVAAVRAELDELAAQVGTGALSAALAAKAEPAIQARLDAAQAVVDELGAPAKLSGLIEPGPEVAERWEAATITTRREVLRLVCVPEVLGQVRILRSNKRGPRRVPVTERVRWKRHD